MKLRIEHLFALLLPVAASCSHEEMADAVGETPIELTATLGTATRADNGLQTAFGENDEVGVYILTSKDGTTSKMTGNELFKVAGSDNRLVSTTGTRYFFPTDGSATSIYAYKPYINNGTTGIEGQTFKVSTNQTTTADYIASDLLCGVPETGNPVAATPNAINLTFSHQCAKLVVNLTAADGISLDGATLQTSDVIIGMTHSGLLDYPFTPNEEAPREAITFGTLTADAQQTHVALLVPQTINSGTGFVRIAFSDASNPLVLTLPNALTLEAGKEYTLNITARRTQLEMTGISIAPWQACSGGDGDLSGKMPLHIALLPATYTVEEDAVLTGTATDKAITIADGKKVVLKNVNLSNGYIYCRGDAEICLKESNIINGKYGISGIRVCNECTLTITGDKDATLNVTGGPECAGIGGGQNGSRCGNIIIKNVNITARGALDAAGIGGGEEGHCGNITIMDANVSATGSTGGSGIGAGKSGKCGTISISNSIIYASAGTDAAASIGKGRYVSSGAISIESSVLTLKKTTDYFSPVPTFTGTVIVYDSADTTTDISGNIEHN